MLELHLSKLLEGTTDAAFAVDLQGEVRLWNKAAEGLFGHSAEFAIGKSCATLVGGKIGNHTKVCDESCEVLECVRTGRDISNYDMEITTRSGESVWVNVSLLVASNELVQRPLAIHFVRDIRDKKKTELLTNRLMRMARDLVSGTGDMEAMPPISPLTTQEKNILRLLAAGKTTPEMINELRISSRTLRNHLVHVNQKLHTKNRIDAVMQATHRGLI